MFLSEPGRTNYDLNFSLFGFPVRVHPAFFILPVLLGRNLIPPEMNTGVGLVLVAAIFFVSILVHELGHALAFRFFGLPARVVMYWMGGLAIPDSGNAWSSHSQRRMTSNQHIIVSLAGPVFGLLLAALLMGVVYAVGGTFSFDRLTIPYLPFPELGETVLADNQALFMLFFAGILLNIFLNLLNLVPIYPLDGGQISREIMTQIDGQNGVRNSIMLSIATSVVIAVACLVGKETFMAVFFGFMAYSNYQALQQYSGPRW